MHAKHAATVLLVLLLPLTAHAQPPALEANEPTWAAYIACKIPSAVTEVRLFDETRVDILTATEAIEADWSKKWSEGIGQACYYSALTDRRPVLLLLVRDKEKERRFINRALIAGRKRELPSGPMIARPTSG